MIGETMTAVAAGKLGIAMFKEPRALDQKLDRSEYAAKLGEAQLRFMEVTNRLGELEDENRELRQRLDVKESLADLEFSDGVYWRSNAEGPYCPRCRDGETPRPARMADDRGRWHCPVCAYVERSPAYRQREDEAIRAANARRPVRSGWLDR